MKHSIRSLLPTFTECVLGEVPKVRPARADTNSNELATVSRLVFLFESFCIDRHRLFGDLVNVCLSCH